MIMEKKKSESGWSIEMKVISCKDLKAFNMFQKLSVYVEAWMSMRRDDGGKEKKKKKKKKKKQVQRTPIDPNGDGNPEWNHQIRFEEEEEEEEEVYLQFHVRHEQGMVLGLLGDRTIGEVSIPLKDLIGEASSNGVVRFVSYQVRTLDGNPNGVLNLSYTFNPTSIFHLISNPNPNTPPPPTISISNSNPNRIQYPTVDLEPVPIPIPLTTTTTTMVHQDCCWTPHPHPQPHPLPFWSPPSYYHSPPPPLSSPTSSESFNFYASGSGRIGAGGMKDGHHLQDNSYL